MRDRSHGPGDERAGDVFSDAAVLAAMVRVEQAWIDELADAGLASSTSLEVPPLEQIALGSEAGGNPVIPLVEALRSQNKDVHRGLTSQDVLDTGLVLCLGAAVERVTEDLREQVRSLAGLVRAHRSTIMVGRTLTQYAVPLTFGLKAATWLQDLCAAAERLRRCPALPEAADLLAGLVVDAEQMRARAAEADEALRAEQRSMGRGEAPYLGATDAIIDAALERATQVWGEL